MLVDSVMLSGRFFPKRCFRYQWDTNYYSWIFWNLSRVLAQIWQHWPSQHLEFGWDWYLYGCQTSPSICWKRNETSGAHYLCRKRHNNHYVLLHKCSGKWHAASLCVSSSIFLECFRSLQFRMPQHIWFKSSVPLVKSLVPKVPYVRDPWDSWENILTTKNFM